MTPSTLPSPTAWWSPSRQRAGLLIGTLLAASALVVQAGVTNGSAGDTAPSALGSGNRTLDKALGGDLTTGDRNLDLLLDSQRAGGSRLDEPPAARPMPDRPAGGRRALQPLPGGEPAVPAQMPAEAERRYQPMLNLPERGQLANPGLPTPKAMRDWNGGAGHASAGPVESGGSVYGDTTRLRAAARPLHEWVLAGVAFVKDHLIVILLAGAAVALLAMGLKAYSRRI